MAASSHRIPSGGFQNPWPSFNKKAAKSLATALPFLNAIKKEPSKADIAALMLLAERPNFKAADGYFKETRSSVVVTWLGHCSFLIQVYGATILTDPVWAKNGVVSNSHGLGGGTPMKRVVPPPCTIADLPEIDAVLLTSTRTDHFDKATIRELIDCTAAQWLVPVNHGEILRSMGVKSDRITELDWYEETVVGRNVKVVCTPSQFMAAPEKGSRGGLPGTGTNPTLWCSWTVIGVRSRLFFAGGTGYRSVTRDNPFPSLNERSKLPHCPVFAEIGAQYGPFSAAFLPIGDYSPRFVMSSVQADPLDAVCIHKDLRARQSIAMNWGTFVNCDEELLEPLRRLEKAVSDSGLSDNDFQVLMHGKTRVFY